MAIDCIVVGSGFCGSVIARLFAEKKGGNVLVVDRRPRISGNMFDEIDDYGILVQRYGPHVFHTDREDVYRFLAEFADWERYELTTGADINGIIVPTPFNFTAIDLLYPPDKAEPLKEKLLHLYPETSSIPVLELLSAPDPLVSGFAEMLYENDYKPYTLKQWALSPDKIDPSVLARVPIRLSYHNHYHEAKYQCLPIGGYTNFFTRLLDHPKIEISLLTDALDLISIDPETSTISWDGKPVSCPVIYTGAIDELFGFRLGRLPYRSLRFRYENLPTTSFQPMPIVAYPKAVGFTRITEYTKLPGQDGKGRTTVAYEYPLSAEVFQQDEPYYPIPTEENEEMYLRYRAEASKIQNLIPCGRLADYKYYYMDQAVMRAFEVYKSLI